MPKSTVRPEFRARSTPVPSALPMTWVTWPAKAAGSVAGDLAERGEITGRKLVMDPRGAGGTPPLASPVRRPRPPGRGAAGRIHLHRPTGTVHLGPGRSRTGHGGNGHPLGHGDGDVIGPVPADAGRGDPRQFLDLGRHHPGIHADQRGWPAKSRRRPGSSPSRCGVVPGSTTTFLAENNPECKRPNPPRTTTTTITPATTIRSRRRPRWRATATRRWRMRGSIPDPAFTSPGLPSRGGGVTTGADRRRRSRTRSSALRCAGPPQTALGPAVGRPRSGGGRRRRSPRRQPG